MTMSNTTPFSGNILITGGAGFLGRGILRYIEQSRTRANVTVYSRDEAKHYALRARFPGVRTILGDVRDLDRLTAVMAGHDLVIHAAALKHIPEAERDVAEAIGVNVEGSRSVAWAAMRAGVKTVIGVSTDKACSPRNAYGATKMLMERAFEEAQRMAPSTMRFACVRYGNVVSSSGSVVPMFLEQFERDGMASITSFSMTRFWLGIDDAVRLIEYAGGDHRRGHVYVLKCPAMPIEDVAKAVWRYAGHSDPLPPSRLIGTRPGEKLHETLVDTYEAPYAVDEGDYIVIPPALSMRGETIQAVRPYSSDLPVRTLTIDEMVELIEDARRV